MAGGKGQWWLVGGCCSSRGLVVQATLHWIQAISGHTNNITNTIDIVIHHVIKYYFDLLTNVIDIIRTVQYRITQPTGATNCRPQA